jgi:hypothetical protein
MAKRKGFSRQRAWQVLRRRQGLCERGCGNPVKKTLDKTYRLCETHNTENTKRMTERYRARKEKQK